MLGEEPPQYNPHLAAAAHSQAETAWFASSGGELPVFPANPVPPLRPSRLGFPSLVLHGFLSLLMAVLPGEKGLFLSLPLASAKRKDFFFFFPLISALNGAGKAYFLPRANYSASSTVLPLLFPTGQRIPGAGATGAPAPQLAAREEVSHPSSTAHAGLPFLEVRLRG